MERFRARLQKSGTTYYYFDTGQKKPRKEIPLGADYVLAVRKWADLIGQEHKAQAISTFEELAKVYETGELLRLAKSTQATARSDIKHLRAYFNSPVSAPLDQIQPTHVRGMMRVHMAHPTTANRLRRLFSRMFNLARELGYTNAANPATGIKGYKTPGRTVYVRDAVYQAVWMAGSLPLRDAMDLAYLTSQRPGDVLKFTERQIVDGHLQINAQSKTAKPLRIKIDGEFGALVERITQRKATYKVWCVNLTVNLYGLPLTKQVLRTHFQAARTKAASAHPAMAAEIKEMWFYDLRAKAADDVSDDRGDQAASDLLGHDNITTTRRHYIRRGKRVNPTK